MPLPRSIRTPNGSEKQSDAFLAADFESPPPKGAIVATGSSSMRGWHGRIAEDLAPLTIIPRGFGGSNMHDVRYFLDELVLRHEPRAVLLYEGDNDVAAGIAPEAILAEFDAIDQAIEERLPETRIYILAVKPSVARWQLWPTMQATNALLSARAGRGRQARLHRHRDAHVRRERRTHRVDLHRRHAAHERRGLRHLADGRPTRF